MKKSFLVVASLLMMIPTASTYATSISYSNGVINRSNVFRYGNTTTQGQAIRLSNAKLQALKGKTIDYAEFVVGSKNTTDNKIKVFITKELGGTPIAEGTLTVSKALVKVKWTLDTPYTITGDEENLYIGFTGDIDTNYKFLISDGSYDIKGYNFAYNDGEWTDTYGLNIGSALIFANVEDAPSYPDAIIANTSFDGYHKAGTSEAFDARFINAGTSAINSFDAVVKNGSHESTMHFNDVDIAPNSAYSFSLNDIKSDEDGKQNITVTITNVNGNDSETDTSDNSLSSDIFFYPENMERSLLVEGFTGQACVACPNGHITISNALNSTTENCIEVTHHVGYQPDMFTMQEDVAYLFYYGDPSSTYAPAVMVNRQADNSISMFPVVNTDLASINKLISHSAATQPYVSLNLETNLDEQSRELKVKLQIQNQNDLPSEQMLYNVFLVQDDIQAYQANGGSNYTHNRVFRGAITGNSWGVTLENTKAGQTTTREMTITIPESIHSSYWTDSMLEDGKYNNMFTEAQTNIEAVLSNMSVVAFVGQYDVDDNSKNIVYNCCEAKLGESYMQGGFDVAAGVENVNTNDAVGIYGDKGKVSISDNTDSLRVYDVTGKLVDANATLAPGIYIVKATKEGKATTKKVLVK